MFLYLVVFLLCWAGSACAKVDLTPIKDDEFITIDVNDNGIAFVSTTFPFDQMAFTHKYSLEEHPSHTYSDIVILDYFEENPSAAWRIWFEYSARTYLGITSITITLDGVEYTFTGVGGKEKMKSYDSYVTESPNILLGKENVSFWSALLLKWESLENVSDVLDMSLPVVLHGTEDIETTINGISILEMCLIGESLIRISGLEAFAETTGTSVTAVNLTTGEKL
ncbi:MAG: hypothetical protein IJ088_07505 [Clostridia bacterium]|nr:hypothetical protein [Clostridia bacterium]